MDNLLKRFTRLFFLLLFLLQTTHSFSQIANNEIVGIWFNQEKAAKIEIYQQEKKFFGKIIWLKEPNENGKPKTDNKNPDKAKHKDPIIGLVILKDLEFDGKSTWEGGEIYDARTGKTYSCYLTIQPNKTLKVRGYMGISLLGKTNIWTKAN
ncbi:DUF2147 domain-containing protein [Flavobacterium sp. J27]|uniref:DUF2147 domain-containing protein n=1 Tax=Flavobacterium sp. J27 TaxID=2060419 RepID=UPI00103036C1|nr:DUF2147 domain-containing protein [Flavobacterium sp. J27]